MSYHDWNNCAYGLIKCAIIENIKINHRLWLAVSTNKFTMILRIVDVLVSTWYILRKCISA